MRTLTFASSPARRYSGRTKGDPSGERPTGPDRQINGDAGLQRRVTTVLLEGFTTSFRDRRSHFGERVALLGNCAPSHNSPRLSTSGIREIQTYAHTPSHNVKKNRAQQPYAQHSSASETRPVRSLSAGRVKLRFWPRLTLLVDIQVSGAAKPTGCLPRSGRSSGEPRRRAATPTGCLPRSGGSRRYANRQPSAQRPLAPPRQPAAFRAAAAIRAAAPSATVPKPTGCLPRSGQTHRLLCAPQASAAPY